MHIEKLRRKVMMKGYFVRRIREGVKLLPKHHIKNLLVDFNAKVVSGDNFKTTIGNDSLCDDSNDNL
jgi:hypothetical protein